MSIQIALRSAKKAEAALLSDLASRSKAHWPYDQEYLELCKGMTHVTEDEIAQWHFTVAEVDGKVAGFSGVAPVQGEFMLDHLWIEPEFIGQGIGRVLFEEALAKVKMMGLTSLLIEADPYAEEFYKKVGANLIGKRESKVRNGFFLPLLRFDISLTLIGDKRIIAVPVSEIGEQTVDLAKEYLELKFDFHRHQVQKESLSISIARKTVGEKLLQAQALLPTGIYLLIKECHRPMRVQKGFWDGYTNYLKKKFPTWSDSQVYDECSKLNAPLEVAPHTTGGAVDLTLVRENGDVLDMGTEFNASPLETADATFTGAQTISPEAKRNRGMLMSAMSKAGFVNYPTEWWHWSYGDKYWAFVTGKRAAIYGSVEVET